MGPKHHEKRVQFLFFHLMVTLGEWREAIRKKVIYFSFKVPGTWGVKLGFGILALLAAAGGAVEDEGAELEPDDLA